MRLSAFSKIFDQKTMTGIDIQPEGAQLVQLRHVRHTFELQKIAFLPFESAIFIADKVSHWDRLTALLFDWVRELDVVGAVTAAALPMSAVKLLRVDVPVQSELQLQHHLDQALPGLGETVAMDYCSLGSIEAATLVAVTKHDYLDHYAACLREAGLDVKIMDVELLAIQRACKVTVNGAVLWQQRGKFTLIWQDDAQLPQQLQWPATYGEHVIIELSRLLITHNITQLVFCGSSYYSDLLKKAQGLACCIRYFSPAFNNSGINMPDYLLAIGLAMREVPAW